MLPSSFRATPRGLHIENPLHHGEIFPEVLQAVGAAKQCSEYRRVRQQDVVRRVASFGGIQMNELNSVLPASVNGCGRSRSIGWRASTWTDFVSSVVSA